jgi:hypothetical protein
MDCLNDVLMIRQMAVDNPPSDNPQISTENELVEKLMGIVNVISEHTLRKVKEWGQFPFDWSRRLVIKKRVMNTAVAALEHRISFLHASPHWSEDFVKSDYGEYHDIIDVYR